MDYINKISEETKKAAKIVSKEAKKVAKIVTKKTDKIVKSAKLTYTVSDIESKLDELYTSIGKKFVNICSQEDEIPEQFSDEFKAVEELKALLEENKDKLLEIKHAKKCPACSEPIAEEDVYCKKCGAKSE